MNRHSNKEMIMNPEWRQLKAVEVAAVLKQLARIANQGGIEGLLMAREGWIDMFGEDYYNEEVGDSCDLQVDDVERLKNWIKQEINKLSEKNKSKKMKKATCSCRLKELHQHQDVDQISCKLMDADMETCYSGVVGVGDGVGAAKYSSMSALLEHPKIPNVVAAYHNSVNVGPHQCCSFVLQEIRAPIDQVWSIVRRFEYPQAYQLFVTGCDMLGPTLRRVHVNSTLPFASSLERLDLLDDDRHVMAYTLVDWDSDDRRPLTNYYSVTSLHQLGVEETIAVHSYVLDTPAPNTKEETCTFLDTIVRFNLRSLARIVKSGSESA